MRTFVSILFFVTLPLGFLFAQENARARFVKERLHFVEFQNYQERAGIDGETRARAKEIFVRSYNRYLAAIVRLEDIADRVESRIRYIESTGQDASRLRIKLASSRLLLQEAAENLKRMQGRFENIFANDFPARDARALSKDIGGEVEAKIERAHRGLIELVFINNHAAGN